MHALLSDPGGDLLTHLIVLRPAAFHQIDGVGFHAYLVGAYPLRSCFFPPAVHNDRYFEAQSHGLHTRFPWLQTLVTEFARKVRFQPAG